MKSRWKMVLMALMCLAVLGTSGSYAAEKEGKVGVVSIQGILSNCQVGKEVQKQLLAKKNELQNGLKDQEAEADKLWDEYQKKKSVWPAELRAEKKKEYWKEMQELEAKYEQAQVILKKLEQKLVEPIFQELPEISAEVAKHKGLSMIFETSRSGLLWADQALDVSDLVGKALDEKMAKKGKETDKK